MNADVIDYAFCDILQVGVEQGWIGVIFCLMTVGVTMWRLRKISVVLLGGAVALVVFSLFSYSFQLFPYQMVMVVLMAKAAERSSLGVAFREEDSFALLAVVWRDGIVLPLSEPTFAGP